MLREYRQEIALFLVLSMLGGFLFGRAILSVAMFLFGMNAIWDTSPRDWLKRKWWLLGLAWIGMYALSGLWSDNIPYLEDRLQVKLPFLLLPLAFYYQQAFSARLLRWFTYGVTLLLLGGCCYTLSFLIADPTAVFNGYFTSKVMPTPAYKDHIRFSIFICWFIFWCLYMLPLFTKRLVKGIMIAAVIFFILFLHILAVKSGLLLFYLYVALYLGFLLLRRKVLTAMVIMAGFCCMVITAYRVIPSFKYKVGYIKYTLEEYQRGGMSANFSDMGRVISYQVAFSLFCQHPVAGVGAGDLLDDMKKEYKRLGPDARDEQMLIPHNQLMVVAVAGGLITLALFLCWLFYPLSGIPRTRGGYFLLSTWIALLLAMCVEPMLEVQFGVFVYLFCLLWTQKAAATAIPRHTLSRPQ